CVRGGRCVRGRRCVRRGSCRGGARGWRSSSLLMLRLRGCGCRHRSRNDKNCRDACVPLEHDTTSYVAHESTLEMACGVRLRRGRGLHGANMACDKFGDHWFRIARPKPGRLRCGLFDWDETVLAFSKWGSVAWACRAAMDTPATRNSIATIHAALEAGITML